MNERKVDRKQSVWYLLTELRPYRGEMALSVLCGLLKEISIIAACGVCAYMAAVAVEGGSLAGHRWIALLLACALARGFGAYMEMYLSHDVAYHDLVEYRVKLYKKFVTLCPDILLKKHSGQVATTLMNDVEQLEWFYGHTVGFVIMVAIVVAGLAVFLATLHWSLAVALLVCVAAILCVPLLMKDRADEQGAESRYRLGEANSVTLEGINGMNEVLTLNWQERYREKNRAFMQRLTDIQVVYAKRMGVEGGLLQAVSGVSAVAINLLGIWLTLHGKLAVEWYAVVGTTVWLAFNPVLELCSLARNFGNVFAASQRVTAILTAEPIVKDEGTAACAEKLSPGIRFDHVVFGYDDGPDVLKELSFEIAPGEIVALVGESGAGKTTCTSLLTRLWDVRDGAVSVGGTDVRELPLHELHGMISVVLQDVYLFNTSIRENIRLGRPDASDTEVMEAAMMARVDDFISSLPEGYDTVTGERGVQMSGGQRQRIAIARALLRDAPILILDEAVSSLDTKTDQEIQETIRSLAHRKTILMVAHRLSTILEADRLVVLHEGKLPNRALTPSFSRQTATTANSSPPSSPAVQRKRGNNGTNTLLPKFNYEKRTDKMKKHLVLLLTAALTLGLLTGCGGKQATGTEGVSAQTDKTITIACSADIGDMNPHLSNAGIYAQNYVFDGLVKYADGKVQPALAEKWDVSDDGLTYRLQA